MDIQHTILGLLAMQPMTGYELKQVFDTSLGFFSGASFGSIYPVLHRVKSKGLATVTVEHQEGRPNRKVYTITEAGRRAFRKSINSELQVAPFRNDFLVRLFFYAAVRPERRMGIVEEYLQVLEEKKESLRFIWPLVEEQADEYQKLCYHFGVNLIDDYIKNTRALLKDLKGGRPLKRKVGEK